MWLVTAKKNIVCGHLCPAPAASLAVLHLSTYLPTISPGDVCSFCPPIPPTLLPNIFSFFTLGVTRGPPGPGAASLWRLRTAAVRPTREREIVCCPLCGLRSKWRLDAAWTLSWSRHSSRRLGLGRILGDAIGAHLAEHEGRVGGLAVLRSVQVISGAAAGGVSARFRHGAR